MGQTSGQLQTVVASNRLISSRNLVKITLLLQVWHSRPILFQGSLLLFYQIIYDLGIGILVYSKYKEGSECTTFMLISVPSLSVIDFNYTCDLACILLEH